MQVDIQEAASQLSRLLELVAQGEQIVLTRNGMPVAELLPAGTTAGFPFDVSSPKPLVPAGDQWWQPMTEQEANDWTEGR